MSIAPAIEAAEKHVRPRRHHRAAVARVHVADAARASHHKRNESDPQTNLNAGHNGVQLGHAGLHFALEIKEYGWPRNTTKWEFMAHRTIFSA
jgi:hypothetical protein